MGGRALNSSSSGKTSNHLREKGHNKGKTERRGRARFQK